MTRMIPIVAVVDEDCFHALNDHISSIEQPTPLLQAVMDRNGWTLDALVAGACLKGALMPDLVRASRTENVECQWCDGTGTIGTQIGRYNPDGTWTEWREEWPCSDCTPENVDSPGVSQ